MMHYSSKKNGVYFFVCEINKTADFKTALPWKLSAQQHSENVDIRVL